MHCVLIYDPTRSLPPYVLNFLFTAMIKGFEISWDVKPSYCKVDAAMIEVVILTVMIPSA